MTAFDPKQFLDMETDKPLIKRPPMDVGDYHALIKEVTTEGWTGKKDPTQSGVRIIVPLDIEVPSSQKDKHGIEQDNVRLTDSIMLDLTEGGLIDWGIGKNNKLRRYREALDMNREGYKFSIKKMSGQPLLIKLTHEVYEGEIQEKIGGVAALK